MSSVKRAKSGWRVDHLFRTPAVADEHLGAFTRKVSGALAEASGPKLVSVKSEYRYNIEQENRDLSADERAKLWWLLSETFEQEKFSDASFLEDDKENRNVYRVEVGPRLTFTTAWSSNAVSVCKACGLSCVRRLERSRRFAFETTAPLEEAHRQAINSAIHDRMTEWVLDQPIRSFEPSAQDLSRARQGTQRVPVMRDGRAALSEISDRLGLAFDEWDLDFYTKLFKDKLKRDPSDVECFDLAQSNSEHSRHWFFGGKMVIDGVEKSRTLFQMVKGTNPACDKVNPVKGNSVIAFHDNSSAIRGFVVNSLAPASESAAPGTEDGPQRMEVRSLEMHGILTCETHNFPCGIAPFPGAETGTGGRIRDVHATGRGAHVVAGTSSYCVGNLRIPGYALPWEDQSFTYPANMASPLQIEIEASNGASDYGNKFGEPVVCGYTRSFGLRLPSGERREWIKPIMMSSGVGLLDGRHVTKGAPEAGMSVVKVGGPAYRIGMGGGAASSRVQDAKDADLDFNAVQRGDAEMENKMNRVIRSCIELGDRNPIVSIHDQGAGGSGNVLKEIAEPKGAELYLRRHPTGDETMTALELWTCEFQENCGLLIRSEHQDLFRRICERENCPFAFMGAVTDDGVVRVIDEKDADRVPVELALEDVLSDMGQKTFTSESQPRKLEPFKLPAGEDFSSMLDRVLRLLQVGSKRFLTTKVDRSVTGLIAQQQCVGPLHTPLADFGVVAQALFPNAEGVVTGVATAIGEQPIIGLVDAAAGARMSVSEAVTNLAFAKITALSDVKCSANWMWAAKLPGEGAAMYAACEAMSDVMKQVGVAVDGGKDSLSMAAKAGDETVKCPGQIAISLYAMCPDVTLNVTPDLKPHEGSTLFFVPIGRYGGQSPARLGGSALAQVYAQVGDESPDLDQPEVLVRAFGATQGLLGQRAIAAGHDVSDGGLVTAALEMAFAGNCGLALDFADVLGTQDPAALFAEEPGLLLQAAPGQEEAVRQAFAGAEVSCFAIGKVALSDSLSIAVGSTELLASQTMSQWRDVWEATSFELDKLQANPACVEKEQNGLKSRGAPPYKLTFEPQPFRPLAGTTGADAPKVAILREEGSNGDREMAAAFKAAGFEAWDVSLNDLRAQKISLKGFQGVAFVGGFSYADVLDSAKGWAGCIRFNDYVWNEFRSFYNRKDTFSLGVCNGCQLMALLGWVPGNAGLLDKESHEVQWKNQPRFVHNESGRYESRFTTVRVCDDNKAMMFKGMEGSVLGVWVAHGEGRVHFPDPAIREEIVNNGQAPLRYVDDNASETEEYPFNPNGSPLGITALCSDDGRHLALMPHPERVNQLWQWPYLPEDWKAGKVQHSPWSKMFQNAYDWCKTQQ